MFVVEYLAAPKSRCEFGNQCYETFEYLPRFALKTVYWKEGLEAKDVFSITCAAEVDLLSLQTSPSTGMQTCFRFQH